jgi:hypothetical protein
MISCLLAVMLLRAYVPVGFMPVNGSPWLLEICPSGLYGLLPGHALHHHPGNHSQFESCPFGSAPAAAPVAHIVAFDAVAQTHVHSAVDNSPPPAAVQLPRAHRARAPPHLA